ncbi:MAG TPA: DUF3052 domain-containing protein [Caulobacteraceae bacterium]|jgi:hypothetical protein
MSLHGYSGKSLAEKLGLKPGLRLAAVNAPPHYDDLIGPLPTGGALVEDPGGADIAHLFVADRADLAGRAAGLTAKLKQGAALWISWPKKASPLFVDLTEGGVRAAILPTGWVDVKVCAVDADWSGLKFLRRRT